MQNNIHLICPAFVKEAKGQFFKNQTFSELMRSGLNSFKGQGPMELLSLAQTPYRALQYGLSKTLNKAQLLKTLPKDLLGSTLSANAGAELYEHQTGKDVSLLDRAKLSLLGGSLPTMYRLSKNSLAGGATFAQAAANAMRSGIYPISSDAALAGMNLESILNNNKLSISEKILTTLPQLKELLPTILRGSRDGKTFLPLYFENAKQAPLAVRKDMTALIKDFGLSTMDAGGVTNKGVPYMSNGKEVMGTPLADQLLDYDNPEYPLVSMLRAVGMKRMHGTAMGPNQPAGGIKFDVTFSDLVKKKKRDKSVDRAQEIINQAPELVETLALLG